MSSLAERQMDVLKDEKLILTSSHEYYLGPVKLPALSRILKAAGLVEDFTGVPAAVLEHKREIGVAVHKACELYLLGDLDEESVTVECQGYFTGFKKYHDSLGNPKPVMVETPVYNKTLLYACMPDVVWSNAVDEIKTSSRVSKYVAAQLAGQDWCLGKEYRIRRVVQLKPDGTFKVTTFDKIEDFHAFESALTIYRWKESHGLLK